jgi:hypothetical protein
LERAERQRGEDGRLQMRVPADRVPTSGNPVTKTQALADAGIPTSTAHRYEELAGGREAEARAIRRCGELLRQIEAGRNQHDASQRAREGALPSRTAAATAAGLSERDPTG